MNDLEKRVIELSYKNKLGHIGSCLTCVNIIDEIYSKKKKDERFILSCGHAHLAHLVVREKHEKKKTGKIHDIHCNKKDGCIPTGSLGLGITIALGMALSDRKKNVYCLISDGECAEGSVWESLRIADELELDNLKIYVNANGYGAYRKIEIDLLESQIMLFNPRVKFVRTCSEIRGVMDGLESHYKSLTKEEYEKIIR